MKLVHRIARQAKTKCPVLDVLYQTEYYPANAEWFNLMNLMGKPNQGINVETRLNYLLFLLEYLDEQ